MLKRLSKDRRGVSTVIGATFFTLIILGGFSLILWEMNQYDNYMQIVNERNKMDWEKQNEKIEIVGVAVASSDLNVSIKNNGAVTAHLMDLWVTEYNSTANWHKLFEIDYYVNPGDTATSIGENLTIVGLDPDFTYEVKVATERGNIATARYEPEVIEEEEKPPVHAFGVFSLDWFYFMYTSTTYPEPTSAGSVYKRDDYVAFYIKVINNHNEKVTIFSTSMLMLLVEWQEPHFNLVRAVSYSGSPTITPYDDNDPIVVGPHQSRTLIFAAENAGLSTWAWTNQMPYYASGTEGAIAMTALVYTMESDPTQVLAQSLPFQALVLTD